MGTIFLMVDNPPAPPGVDPTTPSPARMYDYVLGGVHNFPVGRAAAERVRAQASDLEDAAWVNRGFHQRAARWMAERQGIRQFIDIGSGLPTPSNTHGVVQRVAPEARVAYVDNDPRSAPTPANCWLTTGRPLSSPRTCANPMWS